MPTTVAAAKSLFIKLPPACSSCPSRRCIKAARRRASIRRAAARSPALAGSKRPLALRVAESWQPIELARLARSCGSNRQRDAERGKSHYSGRPAAETCGCSRSSRCAINHNTSAHYQRHHPRPCRPSKPASGTCGQFDQRPGAPRHRPDPPRDAPPRRNRAGHWAHQGRAPDGPQLPQGSRRRPHQCRARRCRLQLQPAAALARAAFACLDADAARTLSSSPIGLKNAFLLVLHGRPNKRACLTAG